MGFPKISLSCTRKKRRKINSNVKWNVKKCFQKIRKEEDIFQIKIVLNLREMEKVFEF